ncbi:Bacterial type II secretion system protein F domain protein [Symmachiella macrocystis]|uniref:Bacterial type II secretion system protein F domain protein n=1 Tax=Symmachiella macrocystis TaxID=2527985 RepID=A0A5C6B5F4_9PLAN|nr:type II secretion system F family protein [Symmachiella macrocystis]TWU06721.1 Bacterial type II secretion system protein F domain protein [Symmachiella macrocystis]
MELTTILPYAVFGCFAIISWIVFNVLTSKDSRASERLDELKTPTSRALDSEGQGVGNMLSKAAPALSKAMKPKTELEENQLRVKLANAGFNSPNAPSVFLALKFAGLIAGFLGGGGFGVIKYGINYNGLVSLVVGAGIGMFLPELILRFITHSRVQKIFLSLPDALDLLVVCVEAGLGLDAAMRRVSEELQDTAPDLCAEFDLCNLQLQMGRQRREVLHDLGVRSGVDDLKALAAILIQADKFGSSVAQALRVQSDSMRVKRSQLAEERAAKTAVQMIFPLVLFIFPGIFVVLVGPAAISMINNLLTK